VRTQTEALSRIITTSHTNDFSILFPSSFSRLDIGYYLFVTVSVYENTDRGVKIFSLHIHPLLPSAFSRRDTVNKKPVHHRPFVLIHQKYSRFFMKINFFFAPIVNALGFDKFVFSSEVAGHANLRVGFTTF